MAVCAVSIVIQPVLGTGLAHLRETIGRAPGAKGSSFSGTRTLYGTTSTAKGMSTTILSDDNDEDDEPSVKPVQLPPASPVHVHEHCRTVSVASPPLKDDEFRVPDPPPTHQPPYRGSPRRALSPHRSARGFENFSDANRYGVQRYLQSISHLNIPNPNPD